jgi:hypothetical protein
MRWWVLREEAVRLLNHFRWWIIENALWLSLDKTRIQNRLSHVLKARRSECAKTCTATAVIIYSVDSQPRWRFHTQPTPPLLLLKHQLTVLLLTLNEEVPLHLFLLFCTELLHHHHLVRLLNSIGIRWLDQSGSFE